MLTSHLGRPTEGEFKPEDSLAPVAEAACRELLGRPVPLRRDWLDGVQVAPGEIVLLENCRVNKGEKKNDDALAAQDGGAVRRLRQRCVRHRASRRGDHARHRASSPRVACAGPLMAAELDALGRALGNPARPLIAIVAGAKVSTKLTILDALAEKVDQLIVGGGIANTFLLAAGPADRQIALPSRICAREAQQGRWRRCKAAAPRCPLPEDVVVAKTLRRRRRRHRQGGRRRRCRRPDPRHRPEDRRALRGAARQGRHHRLERSGRRVRVRRVRRGHARHRRGRSRRRRPIRSPAAATRSPRSRSSASPTRCPTSRPAAARSWSFSKARRCLLSLYWRTGQTVSSSGRRKHAAEDAESSSAHSSTRMSTRKTMPRRTKIVATLGPASSDRSTLERMIDAGIDVVRINFSHGTAARAREARRADSRSSRARPAAPSACWWTCRARRSASAGSRRTAIVLQRGQKFMLDAECKLGNAQRVGLDYRQSAARRAPRAIRCCSTTATSCSR